MSTLSPRQNDVLTASSSALDGEQYLAYKARLMTYESSLYFAKPDLICPPVCSRHGWSCVDVDALCCENCGGNLCFAIDETLPCEEEDNLCRLYAERLVSGHSSHCRF